MLRFSRKYTALFLIIIGIGFGIVSGCAKQPIGPGLGETQAKVSEAKEHVETVERLQVKEHYSSDFMEAQGELENAENKFAKKDFAEAYSSAIKSLDASKRILKQYYLDTVTTLAEKARAEIQTATDKDPDNPMKDFLPKLDEMLDYADQIQSDQQDVALTKVTEYLDQATQIAYNTRTMVQETLASDISFDPGQYKLSEKGQSILQGLVEKIIANREESLSLYPGRPLIIKIKTIGYTDEMGFREGTKLIKELTEDVEDRVPQRGIERRRFLNQRLSEFRARALGNYLKTLILQAEQENAQVEIGEEIVGQGEEIPPDVPQPYPVSDPRRRICKIYAFQFLTELCNSL